jgi:hypothetical protein
VAFILVARHLSKRHEASVNNKLRETVQYYLAHTGHFGDYTDGASRAPAPSKRPGLSQQPPILGQITGSRTFEASHRVRRGKHGMPEDPASHTPDMQSPSPRYKHSDARPDTSTGTQNIIRHTIDMEWLSQRYEGAGTVAHSGWTTTSTVTESVTHHSVNMGLLSGHYGTGSAGQAKAESRATDIAQLRQRYGSAMSYMTAVNALRNNNRYYDMLSKRNVIGGY